MLSTTQMEARMRQAGWEIGLANFRHPLGYRVWCLVALRNDHHIIVKGPGVYRVWHCAYGLAEKLEREG